MRRAAGVSIRLPAARRRVTHVWNKVGIYSAALLLAATSSYLTSLALYTDQATLPGNQFLAGTIDLTTSPSSAAMVFSGLVPGDDTYAVVQVKNNGNADLRYSMSATATGSLSTALQMTVKSSVTLCDGNLNFANTPDFYASGSVIYGPGTIGDSAGTPVLGNAQPGRDPGDRDLAAGASENLCFRVSLPSSTGNSAQNASANQTLTFTAEQSKNNDSADAAAATAQQLAALIRSDSTSNSTSYTAANYPQAKVAAIAASIPSITSVTGVADVGPDSEANLHVTTNGYVVPLTFPLGQTGTAAAADAPHCATLLDGATPAGNLGCTNLDNASYENATSSDENMGYFSAPLARDTSTSHTGSTSMKVSLNSTTYRQGLIVYANRAKAVVMPGTKVSASVWFQAPAGSQWTLSSRAESPTGQHIGENWGTVVSVTATGSWQQALLPDWTYTGAIFNPGVELTSKTPQSSMTLWVDDVDINVQ